MNRITLNLLLFCFTISTMVFMTHCKDDDALQSDFVGNYLVQVQHISGLHQDYDSIGNFLGYYIDTSFIENFDMQIKSYTDDSLLIDGVFFELTNNEMNDIPAFIDGDALMINYDKRTQIRNKFISGSLNFRQDSIFLDYQWENSDTWSTEATPVKGSIIGSGIKQ